MKKIYFIFKNMKEAEYYWKTLSYYFGMDFDNIKVKRNPYKIELPRLKKKSLYEKIFGRKENTLEIIFKSDKSNLTGIHENIYHFFEDEYDFYYFLNFIKKI